MLQLHQTVYVCIDAFECFADLGALVLMLRITVCAHRTPGHVVVLQVKPAYQQSVIAQVRNAGFEVRTRVAVPGAAFPTQAAGTADIGSQTVDLLSATVIPAHTAQTEHTTAVHPHRLVIFDRTDVAVALRLELTPRRNDIITVRIGANDHWHVKNNRLTDIRSQFLCGPCGRVVNGDVDFTYCRQAE